jgi:transcriptional regulator with XRE-family HTH domain
MENLLTPSLRTWRQTNGVTLEEIADLSGVSVPMLSRVERGQRRLSAMARIRLARALGVRVRDLFPAETGQ